jgi:hypothetical protein
MGQQAHSDGRDTAGIIHHIYAIVLSRPRNLPGRVRPGDVEAARGGAPGFHRRIFLDVSSWEVHRRNALRFANQWARRHLRSGDLAVLFRISKREWVNADPDQIERLMRRSFVKKEADDSLRPTAKGRLALWIKRLSGS